MPTSPGTVPRPVPAKRRVGTVPGGAGTVVAPTPAKHQVGQLPVMRAEAFGGFQRATITPGQWRAAEEAADRFPRQDFRVDWTRQTYTGVASDLSGRVKASKVERSIVGELPPEAGMADGYATGEATVNLVGARRGAAQSLAAELTKWNGASPLYGKRLTTSPAYVDMGLLTDAGPLLKRQFTGVVRDIAINEDADAVQIVCVDPSERIRELVTLPTYGEFVNHAARRPWAITVNTAWLVDFVLRQNGIFCSPPPRADAIVSCTGHGGLVAEVGFNGAPISLATNDAPQSGLWENDPQHPFGMLGSPEPNALMGVIGYQEFYGTTDGVTPPIKFQSGYGAGVSGWLHIGSWMTGSSSAESRLFQVRPTANEIPRLFVNAFGNGQLYAGIVLPDGTIVGTGRITPNGSAWHHVGVHWQWTSNTALTVRIRCDATVTTFNLTHAAVTVNPSSLQEGYKANCQLRAYLWRSWSNLQMWPAYNPPSVAEWQALESWVPQADIDPGMNELLYLPDISSVDSWDLLKAVIGAELGVHGFDVSGRYFFRPRRDSRAEDATIEIDVKVNLRSVQHEISSDAVRNVVGYTSTAKYHARVLEKVVEAKDALQFTVPAGKKYTYEVDWPFGAAGYQGGVLPYCYQTGADTATRDAATFKPWSGDIAHGWTYSTKGASGNWTILDNVQNVVVRYAQTSARRAIIIVDNTDASCTKDIRLATAQPADGSSDGEPALRLGGWPLQTQADHVEEYRNETSIAAYGGARTYPLGKSDWRQTPGILAPVCQQLLAAMAEEVPLLEDLPCRGNPDVQVGAIARATFRGDSSVPVYGVIQKTVRELSQAGLDDLYTLRPLPLQSLAPAGWSFFIDTSHYQFEGSAPLDFTRMRNLGYAGNIAKIGQGAGTTLAGTTFGQTLDAYWPQNRDLSRALWPTTFAGYWYLGNTESPDSQAARCKAAMGDISIPIMFDWEDGGGNFSNVQACLTAFRAAGLKVTMLYAGSGFVSNTATNGGGNPSTIDSALGLNVIRARYWVNTAGNPRALFDDMPAARTFGLADFNGARPDAHQFTQYGVAYAGVQVDVDAFPGDIVQLSNMMNGRAFSTTV